MKRQCAVGECGRRADSKGFCSKHYKRMRRGSDPNTPSREELSLEERFRAKLGVQDAVTGCIPWDAATLSKGHGQFWLSGTMVCAHRIAWELRHGPIPDGLWVLHRCDNPPCCNPEHLFLGTHKDNMADMRNKGRSLTGSKHSLAKLTEEDVRSIRSMLATGETQRVVAAKFGVAQQHVSKISNRSSWKI